MEIEIDATVWIPESTIEKEDADTDVNKSPMVSNRMYDYHPFQSTSTTSMFGFGATNYPSPFGGFGSCK